MSIEMDNLIYYLKESEFHGTLLMVGDLHCPAFDTSFHEIVLSKSKTMHERNPSRYNMVAMLDYLHTWQIDEAEKLCQMVCSKAGFTVIGIRNQKVEGQQCSLDLRSMLSLKPYLMYFDMSGRALYFIRKHEAKPEFKESDVTDKDLNRFLFRHEIKEPGFYTYRKKQGEWRFIWMNGAAPSGINKAGLDWE